MPLSCIYPRYALVPSLRSDFIGLPPQVKIPGAVAAKAPNVIKKMHISGLLDYSEAVCSNPRMNFDGLLSQEMFAKKICSQE